MPRYDFKCRVCDSVFEAVVPNTINYMTCLVCTTNKDSIAAIADRQLCKPAAIITGGGA